MATSTASKQVIRVTPEKVGGSVKPQTAATHHLQTSTKSEKSENSKVAIILTAFVVCVIGMLFGAYYLWNKAPAETAESIKLAAPGTYLEIPEVKTNFGSYGSVYAKVTADIDYNKKDFKDGLKALEAVKPYMPVISNAVIQALTDLKPMEVKEGGPAYVASKIKKRVNQDLKPHNTGTKVKDILMQEFVFTY